MSESRALEILREELERSPNFSEKVNHLSIKVKWGQQETAGIGIMRAFLEKHTDVFGFDGTTVKLLNPKAQSLGVTAKGKAPGPPGLAAPVPFNSKAPGAPPAPPPPKRNYFDLDESEDGPDSKAARVEGPIGSKASAMHKGGKDGGKDGAKGDKGDFAKGGAPTSKAKWGGSPPEEQGHFDGKGSGKVVKGTGGFDKGDGKGNGCGGKDAGFEGKGGGYGGKDGGCEAKGGGYGGKDAGFEGKGAGYGGKDAGYEAKAGGYGGKDAGFEGKGGGYGKDAGFDGKGGGGGYQDGGFEAKGKGVDGKGPGFDGGEKGGKDGLKGDKGKGGKAPDEAATTVGGKGPGGKGLEEAAANSGPPTSPQDTKQAIQQDNLSPAQAQVSIESFKSNGVEIELSMLSKKIAPSEEARTNAQRCLALVRSAVSQQWGQPNGNVPSVELCGSYAQGLEVPGSAMDISFRLPPGLSFEDKARYESELRNQLSQKSNFLEVCSQSNIYPHTTSPLAIDLKGANLVAHIMLDEQRVNRPPTLDEVIKQLCDCCEASDELVRLVKIWSVNHGLANHQEGFINGVGWVLLVVFFLQKQKLIPPYSFLSQGNKVSPTKPPMPLSSLLQGFFDFLTNRMGAPLLISLWQGEDGHGPPSLFIEDPAHFLETKQQRSLSEALGEVQWNRIIDESKKAFNRIKVRPGRWFHWAEVFDPTDRKPDKIHGLAQHLAADLPEGFAKGLAPADSGKGGLDVKGDAKGASKGFNGPDGKGMDAKGAEGKGMDGKGAPMEGKGAPWSSKDSSMDGKGMDGKGMDGKSAPGKDSDGKGWSGKDSDAKGGKDDLKGGKPSKDSDGKGWSGDAKGWSGDAKGWSSKDSDGKGAGDAKGWSSKDSDGKGAGDAKGWSSKDSDGKGGKDDFKGGGKDDFKGSGKDDFKGGKDDSKGGKAGKDDGKGFGKDDGKGYGKGYGKDDGKGYSKGYGGKAGKPY